MAVSDGRNATTAEPNEIPGTVREVFAAFLKLGLTSFGGPIAHLGYFRDELVIRRRWLDDPAYGELVGLCQFLPGPASSQTGFALGLMRAGPLGGFAAWTAFTLPSALLMATFALAANCMSGPIAAGAIHGLKLAAIAIVAQALIGMARTLAPDLVRASTALVAGVVMLAVGIPTAQIGVIAAGAIVGLLFCSSGAAPPQGGIGWVPRRRAAVICLACFAMLLVVLPIAAAIMPGAAIANIFYRAGALVFGGGHVVLPLLRAGLVPHWLSDDVFLAGYGAAQAVPGPLFTIATYLGVQAMPGQPVVGGMIALVAIFTPGLLLITGALPYRRSIAASARARAAIAGVNATVVGILGAALYDPLWTQGVSSVLDAAVAIAGCLLLVRFRAPPLAIVLASVVVMAIASGGR